MMSMSMVRTHFWTETARGHGGGYRLVRDPAQIKLVDIVELFEGIRSKPGCLLGEQEVCSDRNPCTAHHRWKAAGAAATAFYRETSIADLLVEPGRKTRA